MPITRTRLALQLVVLTALLAASIETSWAADSTREALKKAEDTLEILIQKSRSKQSG